MILPVVFIVSGRFVKNKYFEDSIANINKVVEVDDYVLILTCWKCPECHAKLPKKSMLNSGFEPFLVTHCPHCGVDLTK